MTMVKKKRKKKKKKRTEKKLGDAKKKMGGNKIFLSLYQFDGFNCLKRESPESPKPKTLLYKTVRRSGRRSVSLWDCYDISDLGDK